MSIPHAKVIFIHELLNLSAPSGKYIRTAGVIESYHLPSSTCVLSHKGVSYTVDVELIRSELCVGSIYQVFGEVQPVDTKV